MQAVLTGLWLADLSCKFVRRSVPPRSAKIGTIAPQATLLGALWTLRFRRRLRLFKLYLSILAADMCDADESRRMR